MKRADTGYILNTIIKTPIHHLKITIFLAIIISVMAFSKGLWQTISMNMDIKSKLTVDVYLKDGVIATELERKLNENIPKNISFTAKYETALENRIKNTQILKIITHQNVTVDDTPGLACIHYIFKPDSKYDIDTIKDFAKAAANISGVAYVTTPPMKDLAYFITLRHLLDTTSKVTIFMVQFITFAITALAALFETTKKHKEYEILIFFGATPGFIMMPIVLGWAFAGLISTLAAGIIADLSIVFIQRLIYSNYALTMSISSGINITYIILSGIIGGAAGAYISSKSLRCLY